MHGPSPNHSLAKKILVGTSPPITPIQSYHLHLSPEPPTLTLPPIYHQPIYSQATNERPDCRIVGLWIGKDGICDSKMNGPMWTPGGAGGGYQGDAQEEQAKAVVKNVSLEELYLC